MRNPILALRDKRATHGRHPGLLLQRYLCENATGKDGNPEEKRALLEAAIRAAANQEEVRALYKLAFDRRHASLPEGTRTADLRTVGRLIVGLGSENVLETGIRLHHTYGMPVLPGSALKGLAAHYCDQVWGTADEKFRLGEAYHRLLFGTNDDGGCITFHDAWFIPDSELEPLKLDVMTPHHPKWLDGSVPPTDFDSPTPVPFLSVAGAFRIAVTWWGPNHVEANNWIELAQSLLKEALAEWGIGGKTTSGYGRLSEGAALPTQGFARSGASRDAPDRDPARPVKRTSGTRTTVCIIGKRDKGFDVQEEGRLPGTLTVGPQPATLPEVGDTVEVEVHNDDPKKPQYRWPRAEADKKSPSQGKPKR
ncbi:MAG: type III-B CRISPR module RAMP protein Cmr6 [Thermogutta sp.]